MSTVRRKLVMARVWISAVGLVLGTFGSARTAAQQATLPPEVIAYADTILYNGNILTADEKFTIAEAVAIRDGKFLAVGDSARIRQMAGAETRRIDLKGRTVMPGLVDVHQHPFTEGMMAYWVARNNVPWEGHLPHQHAMDREIWVTWNDADQALRDITRAVKAAKPGEVIAIPLDYGRGMQSPGRRFCQEVSLAKLDAVSPQNPVILFGYVNLAGEAANSAAARLLNQEEPSLRVFTREGYPCLDETARTKASELWYWSLTWEEKLDAFRKASHRANRWGVTTAKEHSALPMVTMIRELWARGELTVRLRMPFPLLPQTGTMNTVIPPEEAEAFFKRSANLTGIGDDIFRFVGLRPLAVGGNTQHGGAWTFEPKLHDIPGLNAPNGQSAGASPKNLVSVLGRSTPSASTELFPGREGLVQAIRYGWSISTDHTVGDRAVAEVLKVFEEGKKDPVITPIDQILTINHTPMARPDAIQKIKELGIRPSIGTWHIFWEPALESALNQYGADRVQKMLPIKSHIRAGSKPALEGDLFIDPPFWRMYAAISRKSGGRVWNPEEAVTRQEALWMSTLWGAYNFGEDRKVGSIERGKYADLVVLDKDYMTIPEEEIPTLNPLLTMMGGKVVYETEGGLQ